jgi:hypothetical protein
MIVGHTWFSLAATIADALAIGGCIVVLGAMLWLLWGAVKDENYGMASRSVAVVVAVVLCIAWAVGRVAQAAAMAMGWA